MFEIYPGWEIISQRYETDLKRYVDYMPLACVAGFADPRQMPEFYDREPLLRWQGEIRRLCVRCLSYRVKTLDG